MGAAPDKHSADNALVKCAAQYRIDREDGRLPLPRAAASKRCITPPTCALKAVLSKTFEQGRILL